MHLKIRRSAQKRRKKTGFRTRMKTKGGRAVISRQRSLAAGKRKKVQGRNRGR